MIPWWLDSVKSVSEVASCRFLSCPVVGGFWWIRMFIRWTISFWHMAEGDEAFARVFRVSHVLNFIFVGPAYLLSVQVVVPLRHMCAKPSTTRPQLQFEV